jgi:hypothetical protein
MWRGQVNIGGSALDGNDGDRMVDADTLWGAYT